MDKLSEEMLAKICAKDVHELTKEDKAFLRARRSYLSYDQERKFKEALDEKPEAEVEEAPAEKLNRPALMKEAKAMGLTVTKEMTAPQIKGMITDRKLELEAEQEEAELAEQERLEAQAKAEEEAKANKPGHKGAGDDSFKNDPE